MKYSEYHSIKQIIAMEQLKDEPFSTPLHHYDTIKKQPNYTIHATINKDLTSVTIEQRLAVLLGKKRF